MARKEFSIKDRCAIAILDYEPVLAQGKKCILVTVLSKKTGKMLSSYKINSIDGVNSYTALMRACKDPSNQFCPLPVSCNAPFKKKTALQDGGNLPPSPAPSNPTVGGNLLQFDFKNSSVSFLKNAGFVLSVINIGDDKYRYPMSFENYYKIKKIDQDCFDKYGYRLGLKRLIQLCKKYSYDKQNQDVLVA